MKVLFDCFVPFAFAHGGVTIQIQQTKAALEQVGVEVEFLRWWDENQTGDILHFFGRCPSARTHLAQRKGLKVIIADLLTAQGSRSSLRHQFHAGSLRLMDWILPKSLSSNLSVAAYRAADVCLALTPWEGWLMQRLYGASAGKIHIVPNGVEQIFVDSLPSDRGKWLVCTATITPRKRVLELTQAAVVAGTPLWIIGKPYADTDAYYQAFLDIARANPGLIRHEGGISDRARLAEIYREARGFVLLSAMESLSLSALEAAACECPLLLSDLPWARSTFGELAHYCPIADTSRTAECLHAFYKVSPSMSRSLKPLTWHEVAIQIKSIYQMLL